MTDLTTWCLGLAGAVGVAAMGVGTYYMYYFSQWRSTPIQATHIIVPGMSKKSYLEKESPLVNYLNAHNCEDPILARLRKETLKLPRAICMTTVEIGNLLMVLCRASNAKKAIDVGVFTGCSAYAMAVGLPPNGRVVACDINMDAIKIGQPYWREGGVEDKIDVRIQPATQTLQELIDGGEGETFDIMFIDADKANYPKYYELGLQLLRTGGLFVVDNALWRGKVVVDSVDDEYTKGVRKINRMMADDERVDFVLLNIIDGVGIAVKK